MANDELKDIIQGCREGNAISQKGLYKMCFSQMMKVCLCYHKSMDDAAISFNAAMLKVFQHIHSFREEGEFMGWVRRIVVNTCITEIRKDAKYKYHEIGKEHYEEALEPDIYKHFDAKDVLQLINELPDNLRLIFNLYVNEGCTHNEIGEQLKISPGTSKWYLHEARKLLKKNLKAMYQHEINSNAI